MADVTLAECDGNIWLVGGEEHLDLLLMGELPPEVTIKLVPCATKAEMHALWTRHSDDTEGSQPWVLNPLLTKRIMRQMGKPDSLRFSPWSAMLDAEAQDTVAAAAAWCLANPGGTLVLRQVASEAPGHADLQRLRLQLVVAALQREGAPADAVREETAAGDPAEADALTITMHKPAGAVA